jgi:hypothetical protein
LEQNVSVTRETILTFSAPLGTNSVIKPDTFYAGFGGRRILSRAHLSTDRRTATLFYLEPLPGRARVSVVFDGTGLVDERGMALDADGDGVAGGSAVFSFDTLGLTPLAGTAVVGTVYASELMPGPDTDTNAVNRPLEGVTITVDGMEESLRTRTDAMGNFRLEPVPPGEFFVHIDGRTARGSAWPGAIIIPRSVSDGRPRRAVSTRSREVQGRSFCRRSRRGYCRRSARRRTRPFRSFPRWFARIQLSLG